MKSQIERKQSISLLHIDFFSGDNGSSLWHVPNIVAITNTKQNRNNFNIGRNEMLVQHMNLQNIYIYIWFSLNYFFLMQSSKVLILLEL